ncbi:hypothetical protein W97_09301 [Coniosporium apollinis CBS 100218]|uniref:Urease accessory protein n=1 Tax=Coniosporium apollinis (strain CBS 100218) TaxID=1168221 RepID=R7Z7E5_CONA1|nr:uncharacterized protein W97_09301 [Coniosporium apollinis CBS 100218]EON70033.1 hypothetical protein W97_09301 [Coniosporium apollinis CBS 100218]
MSSPFAPSSSKPGYGTIDLALLQPSTPVLRTLSYQYPLKLIAPSPLFVSSPSSSDSTTPTLIHTVFLLTYGGGILAADIINLRVSLAPTTRLILLTQGSTKIFKAPSRDVLSAQRMSVSLGPGAALVYLPDPVQPFANSVFEQAQVYEVPSLGSEGEGEGASLCVCDWVSRGRGARGENWDFWKYGSRNEVWAVGTGEGQKGRRLLLRDNVVLDAKGGAGTGSVGIAARMDGLGVFGTLILRGPVFEALGKYFMDEFGRLPRIGARMWDEHAEEVDVPDEDIRRKRRQKQEVRDGLLWTAASVRGFVLVKFGAREVEGARMWLSSMLKAEGSVERNFGERALLCLK